MLIHDRFFLVVYAGAIVLALLAAMINVFVGRFNALLWLVPVFIFGIALVTSFLVGQSLLQAEQPYELNWMVRAILGDRLSERIASRFHSHYRMTLRTVAPVFLYLVPSMFVVIAAVLFVLAIRGQINPSG